MSSCSGEVGCKLLFVRVYTVYFTYLLHCGQVRDRLEELKSAAEQQVKLAAAVEESLQLELVAAESFHRYSTEMVERGRPSDVTAAAAQLHARAADLLRCDVTSAAGRYSAPHVTFAPAHRADFNVDLVGQLRLFTGRFRQLSLIQFHFQFQFISPIQQEHHGKNCCTDRCPLKP